MKLPCFSWHLQAGLLPWKFIGPYVSRTSRNSEKVPPFDNAAVEYFTINQSLRFICAIKLFISGKRDQFMITRPFIVMRSGSFLFFSLPPWIWLPPRHPSRSLFSFFPISRHSSTHNNLLQQELTLLLPCGELFIFYAYKVQIMEP